MKLTKLKKEKKKMKFVCEKLENIVGRGENAGYQHFLLFPTMFEKTFVSEALKCCGVLQDSFSV